MTRKHKKIRRKKEKNSERNPQTNEITSSRPLLGVSLAAYLGHVINRIIFVPQSVDLIILLSSPSYDLVNAIVCFRL